MKIQVTKDWYMVYDDPFWEVYCTKHNKLKICRLHWANGLAPYLEALYTGDGGAYHCIHHYFGLVDKHLPKDVVDKMTFIAQSIHKDSVV